MQDQNFEHEVDVLVVGTGAAGLTAAIVARSQGLDVLVVEKQPVFGGTTAISGGALWVPGARHTVAMQESLGIVDSREKTRRYIEEETGSLFQPERVDAFLSSAPAMVDFLERETHVRFFGLPNADYHSGSENASAGRLVGTVDTEAKTLGSRIDQLRTLLPPMRVFGIALNHEEMANFLRAKRSVVASMRVAKTLIRHVLHLILYRRGQQVVRGQALVARLARSVLDRNVPLWLCSPVTGLITVEGGVRGAEVATASGVMRIAARKGVILACGGFPRDVNRCARVFPSLVMHGYRTAVPDGNTGDGIRMGEAVGAAFEGSVAQPAAWVPVSVDPDVSSSDGVWPHFIDRQKPGFIAVLENGRRFANESAAYSDFVPALIDACRREGLEEASAWLIADARAVGRWGIGLVRPTPMPHRRFVKSGYLHKSRTLQGLSKSISVPFAALSATVEAFNMHAREGRDPQFSRGEPVHDWGTGDPEHRPNPCLAPLEVPPFYAVKIRASTMGTFAGLKTDENARVLDSRGAAIPGLYAVGNDQASVFSGNYPGSGATLGPAMTFAYRAGLHIAGKTHRPVSLE